MKYILDVREDLETISELVEEYTQYMIKHKNRPPFILLKRKFYNYLDGSTRFVAERFGFDTTSPRNVGVYFRGIPVFIKEDFYILLKLGLISLSYEIGFEEETIENTAL